MNDTVQDWINGLAGHVSIVDLSMKLLARDAIFLLPFLMLGLWFWPAGPERALNQRRRRLETKRGFYAFVVSELETLLGHWREHKSNQPLDR